MNPRWQSSRWLPLWSSVRIHKWSFFVQNGWIQDGRIQDGCHHQVKWELMSLSQIELLWVIVRMEWECFRLNLREDNKVSESKMAVSESNMAEFKMAATINLSQNEWVKFFLFKMAESKMAEFKMAAIIKLSQNYWVKLFLCQMAESKMAEFKMATIIKLSKNEWVWVILN